MKNYNKKINEIQKDYDNGFISLEDVIKRCDKIIEEYLKQLNLEKEKRIKRIEEELARWKYNEKVRDILIGTFALIIIFSIMGMIIWSGLK